MSEEPKKEVKDTRTQPRFLFKQPVQATFNAYPISIVNLSISGAAIEHADPLKLRAAAKLVVPLPGSKETVTLRAELLWSRLSRTPTKDGRHLYQSGIRFEGQGPAVSASAERIISAYGGVVDEQSFQKKLDLLRERAAKDALRQRGKSLDATWRKLPSSKRTIDPEQALLVEHTAVRLRKDPKEVVRLAHRARKVLEQKGEGFSYSDEALAVWEYLERLVSIGIVSEVLSEGKK